MKWKLWLGYFLANRLPLQDLVDLGAAIWPQIRKHIPPAQRVDFLKSSSERHLGALLAYLSHEERVSLMNTLLPLDAREFPSLTCWR